jgi:Flp pilus assembly protein TadG
MNIHIHPNHDYSAKEAPVMFTPKTRDGERGQILVIVAGGVTTLLLLAGLVLDGGVAFLNKRDGQNAADTAAMAASRLIAEDQTDATITYTSATVYSGIDATVDANGCDGAGTPCTWQANFVDKSYADLGDVTNTAAGIPANAAGVRVGISRRPGTFLARLAGIQSWDVRAHAIAVALEPTTAPPGQLLPIALKQNTGDPYIPGQVYDLTDGKDIPGGFGYISWDGSNDPNSLADSICEPDNPEFTMPTSFPGDPGKSNSSGVRACLDYWINTGQTVLIPIYSTVVGPGNNAVYTIVGVAAFVMTSRGQPAVDNIQGYFVEYYPFSTVPGGGSVPDPDSTTIMLSLAQ